MSFSEALQIVKQGGRIARVGWNGKGMHVVLVPGSQITVTEGRPLAASFAVGSVVTYRPHLDMKTVNGEVVPWVASQSDILANDWMEV